MGQERPLLLHQPCVDRNLCELICFGNSEEVQAQFAINVMRLGDLILSVGAVVEVLFFEFCLLSVLVFFVLDCVFTRSGSHVNFCPRPCVSTCRRAGLAIHRDRGPGATTVIAKTLGFLHWLAHSSHQPRLNKKKKDGETFTQRHGCPRCVFQRGCNASLGAMSDICGRGK